MKTNRIRKTIAILLAVMFLLTVTAGSVSAKRVTCNFKGNPTQGEAPLTVNFMDKSSSDKKIISWDWDFGDGIGTSNKQNPTYTYTTPGQYDVTLTMTNKDGGSATFTKKSYITVGNGEITCDFKGNPTYGQAPLDVHFKDKSSSNVQAWYWDFGDGIGTSTDQNPDYQYTTPGIYKVTLSVWDADSNMATEVKDHYIYVRS